MIAKHGGDPVRTAVKRLLLEIGTYDAYRLHGLLVAGDDRGIASFESVDRRTALTATDFALSYLVESILSKWRGLDTGIDTKKVAIQSLKDSELRCAETNRRLRLFANSDPLVGSPALHAVFHTACRKIASILGPLNLSSAFQECRWGSGATYDVSRRGGLDKKLSDSLSVTPAALKYARCIMRGDIHWFEALTGIQPDGDFSFVGYELVNQNRHMTVPKNAKTDRNIAMEPTLNGFLQQGVGRLIRRKLRRVGVDLNDQTRNQEAARLAVSNGLSTIDLRSASDTISFELVRALLPPDWFNLLCDLRSPQTLMDDGSSFVNEKFSSMGNAFTFELETLIFLGLTVGVCEVLEVEPRVWVYGDDIVCPREVCPLLFEVFAMAGFEVNTKKSFVDGYFFESCGKHYYLGVDVTPFYLKDTDSSLPELVRFANRLWRWNERVPQWRVNPVHLWDSWRGLIRAGNRTPFMPPWCEGDDGYLVPTSMLPRPVRGRGYRCLVLRPSSRRRKAEGRSLLAWKLRNPRHSNSHPQGWDELDVGDPVYRFRYEFIE